MEPPPSRIFSVPPLSVRLPTVKVSPTEDPVPGEIVAPTATVTAEFVALPVPAKTPEFTVMSPAPLLVPLSWSVPALIRVLPI